MSDPAEHEDHEGRPVEPMVSARALVGLLADPARRAVFAALVLGDDELGAIARRTGLELRPVSAALDRMARVGLVEDLGDGHHLLLAQAFELAARAEAPTAPPSAFDHEPDDRRRVLDQAFRQGRLVHFPAKRSRRLIVLDHIAQRFEPGQRYTERQVNAILAPIDPDVAALRRYLVDERFLDRADGLYWRSGGTVPVG